jgi:hypothetical protein
MLLPEQESEEIESYFLTELWMGQFLLTLVYLGDNICLLSCSICTKEINKIIFLSPPQVSWFGKYIVSLFLNTEKIQGKKIFSL